MNLIWTKPAVADLQNIRDYIALDSEFYSARFIQRLIDATSKLEQFPTSGRIVPEYPEEPLREIIFQDYRIIFQDYRIIYRVIESHTIEFVTVIHGSRKMTDFEKTTVNAPTQNKNQPQIDTDKK